MIEFKNIMVTTDLSENANAAAPYAAEMARRFNGSLELVHVFDPIQLTGSIRTKRADDLKRLAKVLGEQVHLPLNTVLLEGHPVTEIVHYATASKAHCLIIATHGWTGLQHLLMGSVAERLVRLMPCPVLSIRPQHVKPIDYSKHKDQQA